MNATSVTDLRGARSGSGSTSIRNMAMTCSGRWTRSGQAIIAFLESRDFEDAIRNAISLGGDSDTLAAITGSIAEAAYGIPDWIEEKALSYLDAPLLDVVSRWKQYLGPIS